DLHYGRSSQGQLQPLFAQIAAEADILVLCGDLTDFGLPEEAALLAKDLAHAKVPTVGVLGNHDYEAGKQDNIRHVLQNADVVILDGDTTEIHNVGFAGMKNFANNFDRNTLDPWGEKTVKRFVHEAVGEALKLETAMTRLRTPQKIAILHYAPVRATVE